MSEPDETAPFDPAHVVFKTSSNIREARFDAATGVATVLFANGATYRYANFTADMMGEWSKATSPGSWFHQRIKSHGEVHPVVRGDSTTEPTKPLPNMERAPAVAAAVEETATSRAVTVPDVKPVAAAAARPKKAAAMQADMLRRILRGGP